MEEKITQLSDLWYKMIGGDYHKDKDCKWYINKIWQYGEKPKYSVEHYGYIYNEYSKEI